MASLPLVAIINGKRVSTNLRIASISGPKIRFTDGSECNVDTGRIIRLFELIQIEDVGPNVTSGPMSYPVTSEIVVSSVHADLDFSIGAGPGYEVTMSGPKSLLGDIQIKELGGRLSINDAAGHCWKRDPNQVVISVRVPKDSMVTLNRVYGQIRVGDSSIKLQLNQ
jgi:hypothetical protein